MPRDAHIVKNKPPLLSNFAVQRADGADLATTFYKLVAIEGPMLTLGAVAKAEIRPLPLE